MRISDWSSDVCSSDLEPLAGQARADLLGSEGDPGPRPVLPPAAQGEELREVSSAGAHEQQRPGVGGTAGRRGLADASGAHRRVPTNTGPATWAFPPSRAPNVAASYARSVVVAPAQSLNRQLATAHPRTPPPPLTAGA